MELTALDRQAITDLLMLHGHLMDDGSLHRLADLFTADVEYDVTDFGAGTLEGIDAVRDAALILGDANPVGHHVTNILLVATSESRVEARSKFLGVKADGTVGSGTYRDVVVRTDNGWRIAKRVVRARRRPLGAPV